MNGAVSSCRTTLDVRELGIQFGCVRLIPFVQKGFVLYKERFLAALPPSRRSSTDFGRPVFTATVFYLCAKRHKLKVDKLKLIDLCGTSSSESTTVMDLICHIFACSCAFLHLIYTCLDWCCFIILF
uniref:ORC6 second cyclin-like domain-containing protein n=1 Tax=Aegilops tauschii subsp. strangulata TaxID=200361 RepID=A0A453KWN8_AEGTS